MKSIGYPQLMTATRGLFLAGLFGLGFAASASATTLLTDNFSSAGSTWYAAGSAGTLDTTAGTLTFNTSSYVGIQSMLTYFSSTSLSNIGDSITATINFSTVINSRGGNLLRFAFLNSGGNQISASALGQDNASFANYTGYVVGVSTNGQTNTALLLSYRNKTSNTLMSSSSFTSSGMTGGTSASAQWVSNTPYTATLTITRADASTLTVFSSITGGTIASESTTFTSVSGTYATGLDTLVIGMANNTTFNSFTLDNVTITTSSPIPEPSTTAALIGLGSATVVLLKRRHRH